MFAVENVNNRHTHTKKTKSGKSAIPFFRSNSEYFCIYLFFYVSVFFYKTWEYIVLHVMYLSIFHFSQFPYSIFFITFLWLHGIPWKGHTLI